MQTLLIKSTLTPSAIPFQYLIPSDAFNAIRVSSPSEAAKLAAHWARIAQLRVDVLELRHKGVEPAPCKCWIDEYQRNGVDYARVRSQGGAVFGGGYTLELGVKGSAEARVWEQRIELWSKLRKLESLECTAY